MGTIFEGVPLHNMQSLCYSEYRYLTGGPFWNTPQDTGLIGPGSRCSRFGHLGLDFLAKLARETK